MTTRRQEVDALARRLQVLAAVREDEPEEPRRNAAQEAFGNAGTHFLNDDFVRKVPNVPLGPFGDADFGRRGERESGRRRQPRHKRPASTAWDAGLAPGAFGTESLLGMAPAPAPPSPLASPPRRGTADQDSGNRRRGSSVGGFIGRWLSR